MRRTWTRLAGAGLLSAAIVGAVVVTGTAGATGGPKTYTASITPTQLTAAAGQVVALTLTNTSKNNIAFDAVNVTIPTGLTVDPATPPTLSRPGTATVSGRTVQLRGLGVPSTPPGNQVTVRLTLGAVPTTCQTFRWVTDVRQSNNFNGTYNQFTLKSSVPTQTGPCSSATALCTAGDGNACTTGTITSPGGTAKVEVVDGDTVTGTLEAALQTPTFQCDEYTATSDQLVFDLTITNGAGTSGMSKLVTFSQVAVPGRPANQYQVCFKAPYAFPALLPSQLADDFANGDFSGNTQTIGSEQKGLLLPCSAGYGVPCIVSRQVVGTTATVVTRTAVADPAMRF